MRPDVTTVEFRAMKAKKSVKPWITIKGRMACVRKARVAYIKPMATA
jgi:hypothetical protein